jgi:hypothetical protein
VDLELSWEICGSKDISIRFCGQGGTVVQNMKKQVEAEEKKRLKASRKTEKAAGKKKEDGKVEEKSRRAAETHIL